MTPTTIIVVEDETIVAMDLQGRLQRAGYSVPAIALSGEEAIEFAEQFTPDLMLMDIGLQGTLDGIDTARQIRARFNIPVVFLTAFGDTRSRQRGMEVSPAGYLVKPFDNGELLRVLKTALGS